MRNLLPVPYSKRLTIHLHDAWTIMLNKFRLTLILLFTSLISLTLPLAAYSDGNRTGFGKADDSLQQLVVYKSPTCGCCGNWISHMESNGFKIKSINQENLTAIKDQMGIEPRLQSCHTAVNLKTGFVFEGHVPAGAIKQFIANPPSNAKGLSVPGMPAGSPGMEMGNRFNPYQIVQINKDQAPSLYMNVENQAQQSQIGAE